VRPLIPPPGSLDVATIVIADPVPGASYLEDANVDLRWTTNEAYPNASTIALVLDGYPRYNFDLLDRAVWGGAVPPSGRTALTIADGKVIDHGVWTQQNGTLPHDRLLTLVVEVVSEGHLLAISDVVPFAIGRSFPARGTPCDPALGPVSCANPMEAMSCSPVTETCERVCGSFRDCLGIVPSHDCGVPRGANRYCE
jgi:hypothetical protein